MPERRTFIRPEGYYAVLFHELTHPAGHASRLNRDAIRELAAFGLPVYSREELVAELGSAMVAGTVRLDTPDLLSNAAAYIDGWRRAIKDDSKAVVWAAGRAQAAAGLILGEGERS